jgi:thiol:disulfide interchange protein DsbD
MRLVSRALLLILSLAAGATLAAQPGPPLTATLTPLVETDAIRAGSTVRLAMRVVLAPELHVQSNTPADPGFIATVLTVEPPAGMTVEELVYPAASELTQVGLDEPLSVYEHDFVIGVRLKVASTVTPGTVVISARVRYQACNDRVCFRPITAVEPWVVRIVAADAAVTSQHQDVFSAIKFGAGITPPARTEAGEPAAASLWRPPSAATDWPTSRRSR